MSRLLHRHFSTTATTQFPSVKSLSEDLYKERDLKRLVEKFKLCSSSYRFRAKSGIYEDIVRRLASAKRFSWIEEILEHQTQFKSEVARENFTIRLIKLYGQSRMFENAKNMFDEMPNRNCERTIKSVNALLSACVNSRKFEEMDRLLREMETNWKFKPDMVSYNIVIKGLCKMGEFDRALDVVDQMGRNAVNPDLITFNTLLDQLYKNKRFDDAEKMWKRMSADKLSPDIRSYNARLVGLVYEKKFKAAVEFIGEMGTSGIKPDVFTYGALIKGYCDSGNMNEVKKWYQELVKNEFVPNKALLRAVLLCASEQDDHDWCFELCKELFTRKLLVDSKVLQKVVDRLVKNSRIEEAKKVVHLGKSNGYCCYKLQLALQN